MPTTPLPHRKQRKKKNCLEKKERITTLKINISSKNKLLLPNLKINSEIEGTINIPYIWIKEDSWGLSLYDYKLNIIPKIENLNKCPYA